MLMIDLSVTKDFNNITVQIILGNYKLDFLCVNMWM